MKKQLLPLFVFCATIFHYTPSEAHNAHIKEASINKGEAEIHNISTFNLDDDDSFGNELELSYGFTDRFKLEVAVESEDGEGEDFDLVAGTEIAAQFKFFDEGEYVPATFLYVAYEFDTEGGEEGVDEVALMGIFGKHIGKFNNTLNVEFTKSVGENAEGGIGFGINAQSVYEFSHELALGAEYFGEFGQIDDMDEFDMQGHQLGPVIQFEPIEDVHGSVAYLFGISDHAPDGAIKLEIGYEF